MATNLKELKCGECGDELHRLYLKENGAIMVECVACLCKTDIDITPAKIQLIPNEGLGVLCVPISNH